MPPHKLKNGMAWHGETRRRSDPKPLVAADVQRERIAAAEAKRARKAARLEQVAQAQ